MTPQISSFFGIKICMYYSDHNPPHFHVEYQDFEAQILIENCSIYKGNLPPKAFGLVVEWALKHKDELLANREKMKQDRTFLKIEPLE